VTGIPKVNWPGRKINNKQPHPVGDQKRACS